MSVLSRTVDSVRMEQANHTLNGPEHQQVRLPTIERLKDLGWDENQIRWQPEWRVPQTPHDSTLRESGKSFKSWPVDLALFDDANNVDDWKHIVSIFEFKAPNISEGTSQLEIYLIREPRAKLGYWTNGIEDIRVYKLPDGNFKHVRNKGLPRPGETLELPSEKPLALNDLKIPTQTELKSVFKRLLDTVVARDSKATRSETQLNELCNLLLLKLESDSAAQFDPNVPVEFQLSEAGEAATAKKIKNQFDNLKRIRPQVFADDDIAGIVLDDHTIQDVTYELSGLNLIQVQPEAISSAFQVFRKANLKAGEGQYFTPYRVISTAIELMDIQPTDKVIDPACGTGGFLIEAFMSVVARSKASGTMNEATARTWAHRQLYGVDKDSINVKLARATLISLGDGSVNIYAGDSIREDRWHVDYPQLKQPMTDESFTVVITNPPFGKGLKVSGVDSRRNNYSIAKARSGKYQDLEIGLIFLERSFRLLVSGGRLGIILPETYFFSKTYSWLPEWLSDKFKLRGVVNIPMEAFQGYCRAKTNLYIFEKV